MSIYHSVPRSPSSSLSAVSELYNPYSSSDSSKSNESVNKNTTPGSDSGNVSSRITDGKSSSPVAALYFPNGERNEASQSSFDESEGALSLLVTLVDGALNFYNQQQRRKRKLDADSGMVNGAIVDGSHADDYVVVKPMLYSLIFGGLECDGFDSRWFHLNFLARPKNSPDSHPQLFFAEVRFFGKKVTCCCPITFPHDTPAFSNARISYGCKRCNPGPNNVHRIYHPTDQKLHLVGHGEYVYDVYYDPAYEL